MPPVSLVNCQVDVETGIIILLPRAVASYGGIWYFNMLKLRHAVKKPRGHINPKNPKNLKSTRSSQLPRTQSSRGMSIGNFA
jgi:hypothetical protein